MITKYRVCPLFTREWDGESSTYYYRARQYNPGIGRFPVRDLIGYEGGINLYSYVQNNPIAFSDPLGLSWTTWDFVKNYLKGKNDKNRKDIVDIGSLDVDLLGTYQKAPEVVGVIDEAKNLALSETNALLNSCAEKGSIFENGHKVISIKNTIFSIAGHYLHYNVSCEYATTLKTDHIKCGESECELSFFFVDEFAKPLDLFNWGWGILEIEIGNPYKITGSWSEGLYIASCVVK